MQSEDRMIHFSSELVHRARQHPRPALQKLYYELSQTRTAAFDNTDFSQPTHARFYTKRGQKAQSIALFLRDRFVLIEEWPDIALSDYIEKLREVVSRSMNELEVPMILAQTVTLRTTFALTHYDDAREFVINHMCNQSDRIAPFFQRPISTGGMRFVMPETPEDSGNLQVLMESFRNSPNEVYVEVKGLFGKMQVGPDDLDEAIGNIQMCRSFISDNVFPFLNQYDTPKEGLV